MKSKITLLTYFFVVCAMAQTPFECNDGKFYQVISGALKSYNPITGSYSASLHTYDTYNAGGYNGVDNYLYAIKNKDKHLLRIGMDAVVDLGAVAPNNATVFGGGYAADVDQEGNLWVYQNGPKDRFHKITNLASYDGTQAPEFEVVFADQKSPSTCADIVYINGAFYGGSRGKLYKWDLSSGTPVFSSKSVSNLPRSTFGAAYADANNRLYISDNNGGLYLIEDYEGATPTATLLNLTETTNSNDGFKCADGISPLDKDQDGILDSMDADCDGDGILNSVECGGIDPYGDDDGDDLYNYLDTDFSGNGDNVVQDAFDKDGDGIPDFMDIDSDNDGIYDIVEAGQGAIDTNQDGIFSAADSNTYQDNDMDGIADTFDTDQSGTQLIPIDTDGDQIYDCYDIDSDNDGIVDIIESQSAATYNSLSHTDENTDGMDDIFDTSGTPNGLVDTDGDGIYDHLDTDSNNDGISDAITAYDSDGDGIAETTPSGIDSDNDGLDDHYDLRKTSFDPENGHQTPASFPVPDICNRYNYLGQFSADGTPLYLDTPDEVSQSTIDMINEALPESYPVPDFNPHYISSGYDTDVRTNAQTDIWVTFVGEGAGYKNTLGFYTYDSNQPTPTAPAPEEITIVFPNVSAIDSGGGLRIGDKVKIGSFPPNTGIGWVLLADAWSDGCVDTGLWQLYSNADYNPENNPDLRPHNVLLCDPNNERIILGFEDIRRDYSSCDEDFNDALFYITASSYEAIETTNYVTVEESTPVTSANDGGLESNGDLASLIAKRNFNRAKQNTFSNTKRSQAKFTPHTVALKSKATADLSAFFPETAATGTETAFISSPDDLLGITNATSVFAVDYYASNRRVAAALATTTIGSVYDHSKTICDRLNGSELLDVRSISIRNHTLVSTKIKRASGEIEYTLTFSIKKEESENEIYSLWNIDSYPEGDYTNFQVWGESMTQVATIANHIIDGFLDNKPMRSHQIQHRTPDVFVQKGTYEDGKLHLAIVNKSNANSMTFSGSIRTTETAAKETMTQTIALSGSRTEEISIDTGHLFDIGFSVAGATNTLIDALYLADGPWGIDYLEQGATVDSYTITAHNRSATDDTYAVERGVRAQGTVKETFNIFRNILAGDLTFDVSEYETLEFEIASNQDIEVILVTKDLEDWNDRLRFQLPKSETLQKHSISIADFSTKAVAAHAISEIRGVVFSIQGDYTAFTEFDTEIKNLTFTKNVVLGINDIAGTHKRSQIFNYPNPFTSTTTIVVPNTINSDMITLRIIDLLGRIVREKIVAVDLTNHTIQLHAADLKSGMYTYTIQHQGTTHQSSFIKQ